MPYAGFDSYAYPGDDVVAWLRANTNLTWCGYYLAPASSHSDTSWMGTRAKLHTAGWGLAPVYVGRQLSGPGTHDPTAANGASDGQNAASLMSGEGFAPGSCIYLDLEDGPPFVPQRTDYVAAWCNAVSAAKYNPGVYCSHLMAADVQIQQPKARIWAYKIPAANPPLVEPPFSITGPAGSGFSGATIWQLMQNCQIATGISRRARLQVDMNTSGIPDPSA